uniref:Uncharacterized protein n=1 Tax=Anguilla anguilla TaxID=7936 RepID=A0A0E9RFY7_ANGAN
MSKFKIGLLITLLITEHSAVSTSCYYNLGVFFYC